MSDATIERVEATGQTCAELPAEEYHADPAIGSSMLEDFRESRRLYEGRYTLKTIPPRDVTPAMQLGTWFHTRLLEPGRYFDLLADPLPESAPDGKNWYRRKGSDHERWWAEELERRQGKIAIGESTRKQIESMAASLLSRRWAHRLLEGNGECEFSIFWTDAETGLNLKCRVDWKSLISLDIKTTERPWPSAFVRTAVELGYHRKRAHYLAGLQAFTGEKEPMLLHLAVGSVPPYSAGAYELGDTDRYVNASLGLMEWRHTLRTLAKCIETGDFSDAWEREIMLLEYPAYAFTQSQYQI